MSSTATRTTKIVDDLFLADFVPPIEALNAYKSVVHFVCESKKDSAMFEEVKQQIEASSATYNPVILDCSNAANLTSKTLDVAFGLIDRCAWPCLVIGRGYSPALLAAYKALREGRKMGELHKLDEHSSLVEEARVPSDLTRLLHGYTADKIKFKESRIPRIEPFPVALGLLESEEKRRTVEDLLPGIDLDHVYLGGQVWEEQLRELRDRNGLRSVICTRDPSTEAGAVGLGVLAKEEEMVTALGLSYANLTLDMDGKNTPERRQAVLDALNTMPKPIVIHCRTGRRVPAVFFPDTSC